MKDYAYTAVERFLKYVQIDTQSDPDNNGCPSTAKQKVLGSLLVTELQELGLKDAAMDNWGYIYATIPSNTTEKVPVIAFCSHMDTAPDCSGKNVRPIVHPNYDGKDIVLPDDPTQILSVKDFPYLKEHMGHSIITASGKTLLGADDKSGIAEIMDLANYLVTHPEIPHGTIKILFTPDEEIGRGADKIDLKKLGADFAYTLDGGNCGDYEDETFSADAVVITINGVIAHPGSGKGKLVNALKIAGKILAALPDGLSPEHTEKREGFIHPVAVSGLAEKVRIEFIIRDFDTPKLAEYERLLHSIVDKVLEGTTGTSYTFEVKEEYRNMHEILVKYPKIAEYTRLAYEAAGLTVRNEPIRGGTDGCKLSFMGLPCPNLFTGMQAIHSRREWIGVRDMEKAVDMLVALVKIWKEKSTD